MSYRDEATALRCRVETLERQLAEAERRLAARSPKPPRDSAVVGPRPRSQKRFALAAAVALCGALGAATASKVRAMKREPAHGATRRPPETDARTERPTPPAGSNAAVGPWVYVASGFVTHVSGSAPVEAGASCLTVVQRSAEGSCFARVTCEHQESRIWFRDNGSCSVDARGDVSRFAGRSVANIRGHRTRIELDGPRFNVTSDRPGSTSIFGVELDSTPRVFDLTPPLVATRSWSTRQVLVPSDAQHRPPSRASRDERQDRMAAGRAHPSPYGVEGYTPRLKPRVAR